MTDTHDERQSLADPPLPCYEVVRPNGAATITFRAIGGYVDVILTRSHLPSFAEIELSPDETRDLTRWLPGLLASSGG